MRWRGTTVPRRQHSCAFTLAEHFSQLGVPAFATTASITSFKTPITNASTPFFYVSRARASG